jgi:hypothetical protein
VFEEDASICVAERSYQPGAALDVGEHERERRIEGRTRR